MGRAEVNCSREIGTDHQGNARAMIREASRRLYQAADSLAQVAGNQTEAFDLLDDAQATMALVLSQLAE